MGRRYVLVCALIMTVALAVGGLSYAGTSGSIFTANCTFQVFVHLSREAPQTPDNAKFIATLALQQVSTSVASGLYNKTAQAKKVDRASFTLVTLPIPGLGSFVVRVTSDDSNRAVLVANAVCDQFVATIRAQRAAEVDAQIKGVQDRITTIQAAIKRLEKKPANKRTAEEKAFLSGQRAALIGNANVIANIISLPPDNISILSHASGTDETRKGDLTKSMLIALVGGLLACFLFILVSEVLAERRENGGPRSRDDED